ncbi:MAG TPA: hypothetical protein PKY88_04140 [Anaerohalosphaeraceae bacterium]|nr:hypothetical protein [Anaerohalosphaeraceae bacterium]
MACYWAGTFAFSISSFSPKAIIRIITEKPFKTPKTFSYRLISPEESEFSEERCYFIGTHKKFFWAGRRKENQISAGFQCNLISFPLKDL